MTDEERGRDYCRRVNIAPVVSVNSWGRTYFALGGPVHETLRWVMAPKANSWETEAACHAAVGRAVREMAEAIGVTL